MVTRKVELEKIWKRGLKTTVVKLNWRIISRLFDKAFDSVNPVRISAH